MIAVITLSRSSTSSAAAVIPLQKFPSYKCLSLYAESREIDENSTARHDENKKDDENTAECVFERENLIREIRKGIRLKVNEVEINIEHRNCVKDMLTGTEAFVYTIMKTMRFQLDRNDTKNILNASISDILQHINKSIELCEKEKELGGKFDKFFQHHGRKSMPFEEDYCIKKYLIKNNFIDIYQYDIDLNPHNINITGLNCVERIRKLNDNFYVKLEENFVNEKVLSSVANENEREMKIECSIDKFREADYFDLTLKISALATLTITHEQKLIERESFIKALEKIYFNIKVIC